MLFRTALLFVVPMLYILCLVFKSAILRLDLFLYLEPTFFTQLQKHRKIFCHCFMFILLLDGMP